MYENAYYSPSKNAPNVINMVDYNGIMHSNANEQLYTVAWILSHFEKVQFSLSAVSDSLQPHGLQHARLPCPSPTPRVYSNSFPLHGDAIQPSHPLSSPSPPTFNLSQQQGFFQCVSFCIRWPKDWHFSFSSNPSNEYSALISFRIDWFDLAVQGTLTSLLQHHSSKASILWCSAFFIVQLSHPYMTTGKSTALTRWTFVGKVMSVLFNTVQTGHSLSSKEQVSFNFMAAVTICSDSGAPQNKVCSYFHCFPIYLP